LFLLTLLSIRYVETHSVLIMSTCLLFFCVLLAAPFSWMTVLLMRELRLSLILRLWDSYLAEDGSNGSSSSASSSAGGSGVVVGGSVGSGFRQLHVYVCAAFLLRWSRELKRMDFQQLVTFLQRLPTDEWSEADVESLLAQAHIYRTIYSPQHLA
jgi:hypothetical protein